MTHARLTKKIPPAFSLDVDLPIDGITALVGPPVSGKSLLLQLIAGFLAPDSGRFMLHDAILFDAASQVNVPARRRGAAWIGAWDSLLPHMTLEQNIKFAANAAPRLERHRRAAELLDRFGLANCARMQPRELTPAQKLRGAVARALAAGPKLLLLDDRGFDEPLLREIRAATAAPILLATADLDLCCGAANTLVLLDRGRVVQRGTPRDVIENPDSVAAARILGIRNLLSGTIAALDPGRNTSRIDLGQFSLTGPYIKGHFRGDQVSIAVDPRALRVHSGDAASPCTGVPAQLTRVSQHTRTVELEFAGPVIVEIPREDYERQRDNKTWQIEFPPESLKIL